MLRIVHLHGQRLESDLEVAARDMLVDGKKLFIDSVRPTPFVLRVSKCVVLQQVQSDKGYFSPHDKTVFVLYMPVLHHSIFELG
jgi:hypothetical protein